MPKPRAWLLIIIIAMSVASNAALAADDGKATASEVVQRVEQAVAVLQAEGEVALPMLQAVPSPFVWKDSYVFVSDCGSGIILAHPLQPDRVGQRIADGPTYDGVTAAERAEAQCAAARKPGGGWYAYRFVKPGQAEPVRKVSYLTMVPETTWLVGAGVYDETTPIESFEAVSRAFP